MSARRAIRQVRDDRAGRAVRLDARALLVLFPELLARHTQPQPEKAVRRAPARAARARPG